MLNAMDKLLPNVYLITTNVNTVGLYRPEKSLHYLFKNPITSLHFFINPKYRLHLMKQKRAMLRSNSSGIIWSDEHINPL